MSGASDVNLIVIHSLGRAGSLLMQSLLDGHPQIVTLPSLQEIYSGIAETVEDTDPGVDRFIAQNPHVFDSTRGYFGYVGERVSGRFGPRGDQDLRVSTDEFRTQMHKLVAARGGGSIGRREFFVLLHLAYAAAVGAPGPLRKKYVLYHPHGAREYELLLRDFPEMYFVAMTRDPRQDWDSARRVAALRKGCQPSSLTGLDCFFNVLGYSASACAAARMAVNVAPGHFRAVDLPSLHARNEEAMRDVSNWLGIEFDASMLQSTFNGLSWMGNAASRKFAAGLDPGFRDTWRETLPAGDAEFVSRLHYGALRCFEYPDARSQSDSDLDRYLGAELASFLAGRGTLRTAYLRYHAQTIKAALIAFASPLQFRDSKLKYARQIAGRVIGLARQVIASLGEMRQYARFVGSDVPEMCRTLREQQAFLQCHRLPAGAFLTRQTARNAAVADVS